MKEINTCWSSNEVDMQVPGHFMLLTMSCCANRLNLLQSLAMSDLAEAFRS
jgi:hypothetical protein